MNDPQNGALALLIQSYLLMRRQRGGGTDDATGAGVVPHSPRGGGEPEAAVTDDLDL